jgi:uncharacterized protein RhaS with RHS repeats
MNGRVYDPGLGRMLSPDPVISAPGNSQDWNRYSYAWNNPLTVTDPSGLSEAPDLPDPVFSYGTPLPVDYGFGFGSGSLGAGAFNTVSDGSMIFNSRLSFVENMFHELFDPKPDQVVKAKNPDQATGQDRVYFDDPNKPLDQVFATCYGPCDESAQRGYAKAGFWDDRMGYWGGLISNGLGLVTGLGENFLKSTRTGANGWWKGKNGRWYPPTWEGTKFSGYLLKNIDTLKLTGAALYGVSSIFSGAQLIKNATAGNLGGVGKNSADIAMGYIGAFGGWPGLVTAASYSAIDYTIGIEILSVPITDKLCSMTGNC